MNNANIDNWVRIKNGKVVANDKLLFSSDSDIDSFLKETFKFLEIKYPKFHKMDQLSKLGFIASEVIANTTEFTEDTALIFSNSSSSLESDANYQQSIKDFPSPALFVYTLPNIVLGEISIRFNLKSENAFFVEDAFSPGFLLTYSAQLLQSSKADKVVCGWLNLHNAEYDVFLWTVSVVMCLPEIEMKLQEIYNSDYD
ncbi:3-oxoacyl-ACP synthase [Zunongwangia sp.]|uniref:3-oxoacyl-ACP synthase n=1 Tax=Zunongwangia sp. TaxID=1965325 RepID=UPI003AA81DD2